ncbi:unnamed protein product, partial [Mycena citricolor]
MQREAPLDGERPLPISPEQLPNRISPHPARDASIASPRLQSAQCPRRQPRPSPSPPRNHTARRSGLEDPPPGARSTPPPASRTRPGAGASRRF